MADLFDKNGFPPVGAERRVRGERRGAREDRRASADLAETPRYGSTVTHGETPRHGMRAEPGITTVYGQTPGHGTRAAHGETPGHGTRAAHGDPPGHRTRAAHEETGGRGTRAERGGAGRRGPKGARKASRKSTPVFATIACVLVATAAMVVATGQDASKPDGLQTLRFPSRTPGELQISYGPQPTDARPSSEPPSPKPSSAASAKRSPARSAAAAPAGPSTVPRTPPTRSASAPAAKLVVSCPGALGEESTGVILVSARNADLSWTATVTGGLSVTPGQGALKSGVKARVSVAVSEPGKAGEGTVTLRSATSSASCRISWAAQEPPPASDPPPDQQPTSEPSASDTPTGQTSGGPT
jgi:hypothetical protein